MVTPKNSPQNKAVQILYNGAQAGVLEKQGKRYRYTYLTEYIEGSNRPISITMPLRSKPYESELLFPVFANLLSEGVNKKMQCRLLRIDEKDYFGLLIATAKEDTIGPLTIKKFNETP